MARSHDSSMVREGQTMSSIRPWVAWAEGKLATVVVGEGLHVALAGVVEGPIQFHDFAVKNGND